MSFQGRKEGSDSYFSFSKSVLRRENLGAIKSLMYYDRQNARLANTLLQDNDFPKERIWEFLGYAYEDNTRLIEETYKNSRDEIIKLLKEGYEMSCTKPKKSNYFNMIFEKIKEDNEGIKSKYTVIFDKKGRVSKSKCTTLEG